jgi:hypothetical protein
MTRYNYKLANQRHTKISTKNEVKSITASDSSAAMWKIIERHGADVQLAYIERAAIQDK